MEWWRRVGLALVLLSGGCAAERPAPRPVPASAEGCGAGGGPGYRLANGRCASWPAGQAPLRRRE